MKFKILRPLMRAWRSRSYRPGTLGWSLGIGLVIGFSPTVGIQLLICIGFCLAWNFWSGFKLNLPVMMVGSLVVNPLTMAPTYWLYYTIGCLAMECRLRLNQEFFISLDSIGQLGFSIAAPVILGSLPFMILGLPLGVYLGNKAEKLLEARLRRRPVLRHRRQAVKADAGPEARAGSNAKA